MISIYFVLLFAALTNASINKVPSTIRIYSNLAEIIQPLEKLPLEFSDDDWNNIRPDSITLIGEHVNITLQTITEKKKIVNGTQVYIRSPISSDKTGIKLIKATLIDEINYLVKIQDESIAEQKPLYLTVPQDQIFYLEEPIKSKYLVNFTYMTKMPNSKIFVSYLQSNIKWKTQYQLNLLNNENNLIVMANIRNDGKSSIAIDQGELIGGDINLKTQQNNGGSVDWWQWQPSPSQSMAQHQFGAMQMVTADSTGAATASVEQGKELAGLYIFPITKPFIISGKTNYLLPMFRPEVSVDRYGLISKSFLTVSNNGKAQRAYRLRSDRYLSEGNCIIREQDRVVGETSLPNLAAKDKYQFSIGEDADIIFKENVTLISMKIYNETDPVDKDLSEKRISPAIIVTRTRYIYQIHLLVKNFKNRPVNIEYEQKGFDTYHTIELTKSHKDLFHQDGSSIKSNITLKARTVEKYSYTIKLVF